MKPQQQKATASSSHLTMESLALPKELYWDGKSEPISPQCSDILAIATDLVEPENWLYDDNFANEILLNLELKPDEELIHDLVESDELVIELHDLKDENWPPHAADLGTNSEYSELDNIISTEPNSLTKTVCTPFDIDVNFDGNVLGTNTFTTLTPPQSPPRNGHFSIIQQHDNTSVQLHTIHYRPETTSTATEITPSAVQLPTISLIPAVHQNAGYVIPNATTELHPLNVATSSHFSGNVNANSDVKNEFEQAQLVDQIIEELAKDLPDMSDEYESQYTYSPPSQMEESTTDEEWTPSNSTKSSPGRYSSSSSGDDSQSNDLDISSCATGGSKKRRPYGRGVEDRKIRKKEQNKNAATRYRQKKKLEMELVLSEEQTLTNLNEDLKAKLGKYLREIKYLKSLIREFYGKEFKKRA